MRRQKSKKNDANDLIQFQFQSSHSQSRRQSQSTNQNSRFQSNRRKHQQDRSIHHQFFYLHTSPDHAFVLTRIPPKNKQYSFHGPDQTISWESVRMVKQLHTPLTTLQCPICLDSFVVPRITKCGHCFCYPCLIHHVQSGLLATTTTTTSTIPQKHTKCPCCSMTLSLDDVRPVLFVTTSHIRIHTQMTFVKLYRKNHDTCPFLPHMTTTTNTIKQKHIPYVIPCQTDSHAPYCKFNYVCLPFLQQHLQRNLQELEQQQQQTSMTFNTTTTTTCGIEQLCHDLAKERVHMELQQLMDCSIKEMNWQYLLSQPITKSGIIENDDPDNKKPKESIPKTHSIHNINHSLSSMSISSKTISLDDNDDDDDAEDNNNNDIDELVFYQAQDGALVFLNGFNMNCLKYEYGSTTTTTPLPDTITAKVIQIETLHLTHSMKQRYRFLSHVPVGSHIALVEVNIGHLLSSGTKKQFATEFHKRQQKRNKIKQAEQRATLQAQRMEQHTIEERKLQWQSIDPNDTFFHPTMTNHHQQQQEILTGDDFGPSLLPSSSTLESIRPPPPPPPATTTTNTTSSISNGRSFSDIARSQTGITMEHDFPSLTSSTTTTTTSSSKWGTLTPLSSSLTTTKAPENKKKGKKVLLLSTGSHRNFS